MLDSKSPTMSISTTRPSFEAFQIDVHNLCHVATLPKSVRQKWTNSEPSATGVRDTTHADLDSRLRKAEERREEFKKWLLLKRPRSNSKQMYHDKQRDIRAKRLEQKLADAAANRRLCLESVRSKATAMLQRSELVAERFNERKVLLAQKLSETLSAAESRRLALLEAEKERLSAQHELVSSRKVQVQEKEQQERAETRKQLGAKLDQADTLRTAKLAATAAKAGDKVRHAKHVSKMRRLNDERDAQQRRSYLRDKLQTAERRRYEDCKIRVAINAEKSESQFLKRQATKMERLRRSWTTRRLQKYWRSFRDSNNTTKELAERFLNTGVTFLGASDDFPVQGANDWKDPFDEFATRLQSRQTIEAAQELLRRMKMKFLGRSEGVHDCTPLLKRLFPKTPKSKLERYPTRIFLCAYMILNHPEVVFNARGQRESELSSSAKEMVESFEKMLQKCLQSSTAAAKYGGESLGDLYNAFDDCWVGYLEQFVAWKSHDATDLANSLITTAAKMQYSMLQKVDGDITSQRVQNNPDLKNIVQQVQHDHQLLRERVERLTGKTGIKKFDKALADANKKYKQSTNETSGNEGTGNESSNEESGNEFNRPEGSQGFYQSTSESYGDQRQPPRQPPVRPPSQEGPVSTNSGNEVFIWELLYNRNYQLPSTRIDEVWSSAMKDSIELGTYTIRQSDVESPSVALQRQISAISEKAFWDLVEEKLTVEGAGAVQACTMLIEIGSELTETLPDNLSARTLRQHLSDENELLRLLQGDDRSTLDTTGLLQVMDHTADLLREFGSAARQDSVLEAQQKVMQKINNALAINNDETQKQTMLAKAITHALRLLHAQLRVLKFDMANARIHALSCSLNGAQAVSYSKDKFTELFSLKTTDNQSPFMRLPKTKEWMKKAMESRSTLGLSLEPLMAQLAPRSQVPNEMHSGRQDMSTSSVTGILEQWSDVHFVSPVSLEDWRGTLRVGIVNLITSSVPLTAENVPETFHLDILRLHTIQNSYQRLIVTSASLLAVQQARQETKKPLEASQLMGMKTELSRILDSPQVNLQSLTGELGAMAGDSNLEPLINNTLTNLINREKGGFKALNASLTKALCFCLILTDSSDSVSTRKALTSVLSRIGSLFLVDDVLEVAKELSVIIGVNEAVHYEIYQAKLE
eukprot:g1241.t1